MTTEDATTVARKDQSNEIRIGPITRARAKLLEQQVNLLLNESGTLIDENFILPKSMHLCMIRFVGETSMARGGEGLQEKPNMMIAQGCAREEREEGAREDHQDEGKKDLPRPECPARSTRTVRPGREANWRGHSVCQFGHYTDATRKLQSFRPDRTVRHTSPGVSGLTGLSGRFRPECPPADRIWSESVCISLSRLRLVSVSGRSSRPYKLWDDL
jgi:hypothetical protein